MFAVALIGALLGMVLHACKKQILEGHFDALAGYFTKHVWSLIMACAVNLGLVEAYVQTHTAPQTVGEWIGFLIGAVCIGWTVNSGVNKYRTKRRFQ